MNKKRTTVSVVCAVIIASATLSVASAANITYTIDRNVGDATVSGVITTDGTIGDINVANIVDWDLVLANGSDTVSLTGPLSGDNSVFAQVSASPLQGSATQLTQTVSSGSVTWVFCLENATFPNVCNLGAQTTWRVTASNNFRETIEDVPVGVSDETNGPLGTIGDTFVIGTVVPVPAAVWLFGSALGLLGWMRRKTA